MFQSVLIANRGEIACRIIRTAKQMGIRTIAVYSDIDHDALHVQQADEAYCIGNAPSNESYLCIDKIIAIAKQAKAQAIHPGYGFLSENADFAAQCVANQIIFVGPSVEAIQVMGNKTIAKEQMTKAGIPIIEGYQGDKQDLKTLTKAAKRIGLPVLIKAACGGGGKGMRLVTDIKQFEHALQSAKREAEKSFNDGRVFLEKYCQPARHVELQIFRDTHGNAVHLFDRDCSMQRRHQKIIEEAPAPNLSQKTREHMAYTAIKAAHSIDYHGAGTVEFLVDADERFYFMEMNTRLQVEHPVTEMITGIDCVAWQLQIAAGEPLPCQQSEIHCRGHAIEARICAEDPKQDFSPSIGTLSTLVMPEQHTHCRIDTGVAEGQQISMYYDSMIAKIITWGDDREQALQRLNQALAHTYIIGVETNTEYLHRLCQHPKFQNVQLNTRFIERHQDDLQTAPNTISNELLAAAGILQMQHQQAQGCVLAADSNDAESPWFIRDHWRFGPDHSYPIQLWHADQQYSFAITQHNHDYLVQIDDKMLTVSYHPEQGTVTVNDHCFHIAAFHNATHLHIFSQGQHLHLTTQHPSATGAALASADHMLTSPMPGTIVEVMVKAGDQVKKGDRLLVLEAMKMEHTLFAPNDGIVKTIFFKAGERLNEGVELVEFE